MAISRRRALKRMEGLRRRLLEHLEHHIPATMPVSPESIPHWRAEIESWLNQIEELTRFVGRTTAAEWNEQLNVLRDRTRELLGDAEERS